MIYVGNNLILCNNSQVINYFLSEYLCNQDSPVLTLCLCTISAQTKNPLAMMRSHKIPRLYFLFVCECVCRKYYFNTELLNIEKVLRARATCTDRWFQELNDDSGTCSVFYYNYAFAKQWFQELNDSVKSVTLLVIIYKLLIKSSRFAYSVETRTPV